MTQNDIFASTVDTQPDVNEVVVKDPAQYRKEYYEKNREKLLEKCKNNNINCPRCGRELRKPNLMKHLGTKLCTNTQNLNLMFADTGMVYTGTRPKVNLQEPDGKDDK